MFFVGQTHIINQLKIILPEIYKDKLSGAFLFRGASGYGKTELSQKVCNYLAGRNYQFCLGSDIKELSENNFDPQVWVHFIDEIHLMETPEILYPIIDKGQHIFVFATNYDSVLPEALINRCKSFIFTEYSDEELISIFRTHSKINFRDSILKHIIQIAGRNPRVMIKTYASNLMMYYASRKNELLYNSDVEIIDTIDRIHGIKNGLDRTCRDYLECLAKLGRRASINLLASTMRLDINTIKYSVEPILLYRGLIKITSKGRELC